MKQKKITEGRRGIKMVNHWSRRFQGTGKGQFQ